MVHDFTLGALLYLPDYIPQQALRRIRGGEEVVIVATYLDKSTPPR